MSQSLRYCDIASSSLLTSIMYSENWVHSNEMQWNNSSIRMYEMQVQFLAVTIETKQKDTRRAPERCKCVLASSLGSRAVLKMLNEEGRHYHSTAAFSELSPTS